MNRKPARGFSLIEVVAAVGVVAVALVAVLGLMTATTRSAGDVADAQAAARLTEGIQGELERLQADLGLDGLAAVVPRTGSTAPLQLVAARASLRVLRSDGAAPAADHALNDPVLPGIANRDRYYLIEVTQLPGLEYAPGAGFLAVSVRVTWPYRLAAGPPTPGDTTVEADPTREVPRNERSVAIFNFALRP